MASKICVIGPSSEKKYIGGVATHIKNLKSLNSFKNADFVDLGSLDSNIPSTIFTIIKRIFLTSLRIRRKRYDYILINSTIATNSLVKLGLILFLITKGKDRKIHVFFHGGRFEFIKGSPALWIRFLSKMVFNKVTKFHFLSKEQLLGFQKMFAQHPCELYGNYSTDDSVLVKIPSYLPGTPRLLFVGRISKDKGVYELISAVKSLSEEGLKISLTIAGEGPELETLKKISLQAPDVQIQFLGFVISRQKLEQVYRNADIFVFPTYQEGFPYVVIEAMRAGLPIISTGSGALETIVQDKITGLKVLPKSESSLIEKIKCLLDDVAMMENMSANCHLFFKNQLSRSAAEEYYSKLLCN